GARAGGVGHRRADDPQGDGVRGRIRGGDMKPLSVYVHIPFCTIKCGYCDFNAYAGMDALKRAYGEALVAEVRANGPLFAGRSIRSVGFGGGTPGEVPASDIAAVLDAIRAA